jgi:polyhydroxybutyrate depolymerase
MSARGCDARAGKRWRDSAHWRAISNVYDARMRTRSIVLMAAFSVAAGCSKSPPPTNPLVIERPYDVDVPASLDKSKPAPLIVLLHGYGANGFVQDAYFGFNALADAKGVFVAHPDGLVDASLKHYWNADDACCDFAHSGVDDVAYLNAIVDDMKANYNIDAKRVFFVGHSNGAFMSHRMACDASATVAGIVALAGDVWQDPSKCNPSSPVAILQVHGDHDDTVPYDGANLMPSAPTSVATWATKNGCGADLADTHKTLDLDTGIDGAETRVEAHTCTKGAAELWTIQGGGHLPNFRMPDWGNAVYDWLMAHPKS